MTTTHKIAEALDILRQLNVPGKQQNERSALALLALLNLKENQKWKEAKKTLIRIHDMMVFIKEHYGKSYAENSRETFRRQTLHQFEKEVGIVVRNEDNPTRPTNSPNTTWAVSDEALNLIRRYNTWGWKRALAKFMNKQKACLTDYAIKKGKNKLSIEIGGTEVKFSPGKHNELQLDILSKFREQFCNDADLVYVGDTAHKMLFLNESLLLDIGFEIRKHDILPDVVLLDKEKHRLYLIEAVTSHGPISNKRLIELTEYFSKLDYKKCFVTAFPDFKTFKKYLGDIAWETEVWVSEIPEHMIHFNGDKFLKLE